MTFDHWLKEGRERARWLTESILGRGSKEWKSAFLIWTAGTRQPMPGGGDGESEGEEGAWGLSCAAWRNVTSVTPNKLRSNRLSSCLPNYRGSFLEAGSFIRHSFIHSINVS